MLMLPCAMAPAIGDSWFAGRDADHRFPAG
jgi:hypothetical protein